MPAAAGGNPRLALAGGGAVLQCVRPWEQKLSAARAKWSDYDTLHGSARAEFVAAATAINTAGAAANTANPEPNAEDATQQALRGQAEGLYHWARDVNSNAGGKLYEMKIHAYHRSVVTREVRLGASNTDEPDLIVSYPGFGGPRTNRAEEVKAVSVEDERRVSEQIKEAALQLDNPRVSSKSGFNQWKMRIVIRDPQNRWPGTDHAPVTSDTFVSTIKKQLISGLHWLPADTDRWNILTVEGVNHPDIPLADHLGGVRRRDVLRLEAKGRKTDGAGRGLKREVHFRLIDISTNQQTDEYVEEWDPISPWAVPTHPAPAFTFPALAPFSPFR